MARNKGSKYLQAAAYFMLAAIMVIAIGVFRDCERLPSTPVEGNSGGDTIDIGLLYGPSSYYFYSDSLAGINKDIADSFSRETGSPVKIWAVEEPASGLAKLENGSFDIIASMPLDNNIKSRFPVSESVFLDRLVLVQLQDSLTKEKSVNSSLDLNGKTVYVSQGSSALQRISNLAEEIGGEITIKEEPELSDELLTLKVADGSIPLAVVNEKVARKIADKFPNLNYDSSVSFTQFQVWLFSPSDTLVQQKFNDWFEDFRATETYREILNKY